jgi:hypothetical protein
MGDVTKFPKVSKSRGPIFGEGERGGGRIFNFRVATSFNLVHFVPEGPLKRCNAHFIVECSDIDAKKVRTFCCLFARGGQKTSKSEPKKNWMRRLRCLRRLCFTCDRCYSPRLLDAARTTKNLGFFLGACAFF